jgi:hypothetical protein
MAEKLNLPLDVIVEQFTTNRWLSAYELAVVLRSMNVVPEEDVMRSCSAPGDGGDHVLHGLTIILQRQLRELHGLNVLEQQDNNGVRQFRRKFNTVQSGRPAIMMASDAELAKPADTVSGINQPRLYRLIHDQPGISDTELVKKLGPCWRPDDDVLKAWQRGSQLKTPIPDDPAERAAVVQHAKLMTVRMMAQRCQHLERETKTVYFLRG